jgi:hypothetical protein
MHLTCQFFIRFKRWRFLCIANDAIQLGTLTPM